MKNCFTAFAGVLISLIMSVPMAVAAEKMQNKTPIQPQNVQQKPLPEISMPLATPSMPQSPAGRLIRTTKLTPQEFDQLKDNDVIEYQGTQYNVGQLRTKMKSSEAEAQAKIREASSKASIEFESHRHQFLKNQKAKIDDENAKIRSSIQNRRHPIEETVKSGRAIRNTDSAISKQQSALREVDSSSAKQISSTPNPGNASTPPLAQPTITELFMVPKLHSPQTFFILGAGFGNTRGEIRATLPSGKPFSVFVYDWGHDFVEVKTPGRVDGELDGTATISLRTADGRMSNNFQFPFIAQREIRRLEGKYYTVNCAQADRRNTCSEHSGFIEGLHTGWVFGSSGTDKYSVNLKNGWLLDTCDLAINSSRTACHGFTRGASSATIEVPWNYTFFSPVAGYTLKVYIEGPKGVPN